MSDDLPDPPEVHLQAISARSGPELLPELADAIDRASGWVLHRQMVSASMLLVQVETQARCLLDLYASLVEQGLELSRDSHKLLSEQCLCAHLQNYTHGSIVTLHLEIALPAEASRVGPWWQLQSA